MIKIFKVNVILMKIFIIASLNCETGSSEKRCQIFQDEENASKKQNTQILSPFEKNELETCDKIALETNRNLII